MLEMAINNVEMGSELDRVHILTCCVLFLLLKPMKMNGSNTDGQVLNNK